MKGTSVSVIPKHSWLPELQKDPPITESEKVTFDLGFVDPMSSPSELSCTRYHKFLSFHWISYFSVIMNKLDWGVVTPEAANIDENVFTYVFNHRLSSPEEVDRTVRFIIGRLLFYEKHLPPNPKHRVKIDARGQNLDRATQGFLVQRIQKLYSKPNLQEIEIVA